jgi:dTDP-4-dehydrorhamnose reductase
MKILITGGTGFLGTKLMSLLSREHEVTGTCLTKRENDCLYLDITDENQVQTMFSELRPDVVIHTAAISDPDLCESEKQKAWQINVEGTQNVTTACRAINSRLVYISTDYVFDGGKEDGYNEDDDPKPVNYYGLTKFEGEKIIQSNLQNYLIIRVPIFYGFNDEEDRLTFVTEVIDKLNSGKEVYADNEQIRYPTWIDDIASAINELIEQDARGVYHFSSKEGITKYQWALKIAHVYGLQPRNIIISKPRQDKAKRPYNSKLKTSNFENLVTRINPVGIEEGLNKARKQSGCLFRLIYSVKPDMLVLNQSASIFRIELGKRLAEEEPAPADIVVGIPESGIFPATGYAAYSKLPFYFGLIRDYYTQRTVFDPYLERRLRMLREKLRVVPDIVRNKNIVLIDEAIISGATLEVAIDKLKRAGAKEIHVRIPSPPMLLNCHNGVLIATRFCKGGDASEEKGNVEKGLEDYFGADSVRFLSLKNFLDIPLKSGHHCAECFTYTPRADYERQDD